LIAALSATLLDDIRRQITEEKLVPRQWLIERELCKTCRMRRTPICEIL
jgi:DNA-binding GntR family transcriptional regulator